MQTFLNQIIKVVSNIFTAYRVKLISLFTISLIFSLIMAEVAVRVINKETVLFPRYHTSAQYGEFTLRKLRPNMIFWHTSIDGSWKFVINGQGFRDEKEYRHEKPSGRIRVLSVGDSHTEGFEVKQEQTFSEVIERFLKNKGVDAEVLNTGISGFSTAEAIVFIENEGVRYRPDVIVYGLFANDFEDNLKAGLFKLEGERLVIAKREHIPGVKVLDLVNSIAPMRWFSENSFLYNLALNTVWERAKDILLRKAERVAQTEYAIATEDVTEIKRRLMTTLLKRMYKFAKTRGIKLIILDIPATSAKGQFRSSIPAGFKSIVEGSCDVFIDSEKALGKYRYVTDIHLQNGHRHISAFTHTILGVATGSRIVTLLRNE